jgi:hypothetical protein
LGNPPLPVAALIGTSKQEILPFGIPLDAQLSAACRAIELDGFGLEVVPAQTLN